MMTKMRTEKRWHKISVIILSNNDNKKLITRKMNVQVIKLEHQNFEVWKKKNFVRKSLISFFCFIFCKFFFKILSLIIFSFYFSFSRDALSWIKDGRYNLSKDFYIKHQWIHSTGGFSSFRCKNKKIIFVQWAQAVEDADPGRLESAQQQQGQAPQRCQNYRRDCRPSLHAGGGTGQPGTVPIIKQSSGSGSSCGSGIKVKSWYQVLNLERNVFKRLAKIFFP